MSSIWVRTGDEVTWDRRIWRTVWTVVVTVFTIYLIYRLKTQLAWIVIAAFVAIAVSGPVNVLARRMKRGFAIGIVYATIVVVPVVLAIIFVPPLITSVVKLVENLPQYVNDLQDTLNRNELFREANEDFEINNKLREAADNLAGDVGSAAGLLGDIGSAAVNSIFGGLTVLILSIFMVGRGRAWLEVIASRRPEHEAVALRRTAERVGGAVSGYIGGAIAQALVAGIAALIVLSILGVPSPLALAALVALFDVIPMIGSTIAGVIVGLVVAFAADFPIDVFVWGVFVILYQQFENYVIQPRIQQKAVELEPFIILVAVLFGGALAGIFGALLAIPIAASCQIIYQEYRVFKADVLKLEVETDTPL
jgi:predicted PurR-regulated permease PerM